MDFAPWGEAESGSAALQSLRWRTHLQVVCGASGMGDLPVVSSSVLSATASATAEALAKEEAFAEATEGRSPMPLVPRTIGRYADRKRPDNKTIALCKRPAQSAPPREPNVDLIHKLLQTKA